jgi:O-antigen/teichoic acid export membrane protein
MSSADAKTADDAARLPPPAGESPRVSTRSVAGGVSWVAAGNTVAQLAWFASLLGIAALVPPSSLGSVTVAMVVVQVAWLVVGSGTRGSFIASAPTLTRAQVVRAFGLNVTVGAGMGVAAALAAPVLVDTLAPGADVGVVRALALSISLYGFSIVPLALLQKRMHFRAHASVNACAALGASVAAVIAAVAGAGVWSLVLRQVLFQLLLAALAWWAARRLLPPRVAGESALRSPRPPGAPAFFALAVVVFAAMNVDYVIVGRYADVTQLGLYSLAFTIAFAPTTQFAWQVGKVLFPAAAETPTLALVGARAQKAIRVAGLLLLPLVPPAIALAPELLPGILGAEWEPIVLPFQLLLLAGVVQALLAILREFLLGSGSVVFCLRVECAALAGIAVALLALVPGHGIEGAAVAHLVLLGPVAAAYAILGSRRLGLKISELCRPLLPLIRAVALESLAVVTVGAGASAAGVPPALASALAALAGVLTVAGMLWRPSLRDSRALLTDLRPRVGQA